MNTSEKRLAKELQWDAHLIICMLSSAIWVLITHAYMLFQNAFSHDSLNAFYADVLENTWKIRLGRILKPVYQAITRGDIAVPWLIGVLTILWIGLAVYFISKMFKIKTWIPIAFLAGILTANMTVSATVATYIYDLDSNMLSMLLAVSAAYLWQTKTGFGWSTMTSALICLSLCLYQSFVSVAIVLMMTACIFDALNGLPFRKIARKGSRAILILLGGAALYLVALMLCNMFTGVSYSAGTNNSLSLISKANGKSIVHGIGYGYDFFIKKIIQGTEYAYGHAISWALHIVLLIAAIFRLVPVIIRKGRNWFTLGAAGILVLLFPLAMNLVSVFNGGVLHYIMIYASWLIYFVFLLADENGAKITCRFQLGCHYTVFIVLAVILWGNIKTANILYLQKDMEQDATLSLMTRVTHDMQLTEGYVHGETPVAFIGSSRAIRPAPAFDGYQTITGMDNGGYAIRTDRSKQYSYYPCEKYVRSILGIPALMCDDTTWQQLTEAPSVQAMPCYPYAGSIQVVNGTLVVKLGEP